jgi:hypothetical protein
MRVRRAGGVTWPVDGHVGRGQAAVLGALAAALEGPGGEHAGADLGGRLGVGGADQLLGGEPVDLDVEVDAVEQRPGQPAGVAVQVIEAAAAGEAAVPQVPAGAGVRRGDQGEAGREADGGHGPRDRDLALLERLAQRLAGGPGELRQLVE